MSYVRKNFINNRAVGEIVGCERKWKEC